MRLAAGARGAPQRAEAVRRARRAGQRRARALRAQVSAARLLPPLPYTTLLDTSVTITRDVTVRHTPPPPRTGIIFAEIFSNIRLQEDVTSILLKYSYYMLHFDSYSYSFCSKLL